MRTRCAFIFLSLSLIIACGSTTNSESGSEKQSTESGSESSSTDQDSGDESAEGTLPSIRKELETGQTSGTSTFDHSTYENLLDQIVKYDQGRVNYSLLAKKEEKLNSYLSRLADANLSNLKSSSQLALLINAYNAYTLKLILNHYPDIDSIKDIEKPWKQQNWEVGGHTLSLDQIEHRLIRPIYKDPRIHFAVNCAAIGCPPLAPFAYKGIEIDEQLDRATKRSLQDESYVTVKNDKLFVVRIFIWYHTDFVAESYNKTADSVPAFVSKYTSSKVQEFIASKDGEPEVGYLEYDWTLNDTE